MKNLFAVMLLIILASPSGASSPGPLFLQIPDARSAAMGGPMTALPSGPASIFANPALLSCSRHYISLSYVDSLLDITESAITSSLDISEVFDLSLGWYRYSVPVEITDSSSVTGEKDYHNDILTMAAVFKAGSIVDLGISARYLSKSFGDFRLGGVLLDPGISLKLSDSIRLGFSGRNIILNELNGDSYWSSSGSIREKLDSTYALGISYSRKLFTNMLGIPSYKKNGALPLTLTLNSDIRSLSSSPDIFYYSAGGEISINGVLAFRAGINKRRNMSFGIAIWKLDYSYLAPGELEEKHILTLSL